LRLVWAEVWVVAAVMPLTAETGSMVELSGVAVVPELGCRADC